MVSQSHNAIRLAHVVIVVRDIAARTQAWATFKDSPPKHHCVNPGSRQAGLF
jgi:hypothetical protein